MLRTLILVCLFLAPACFADETDLPDWQPSGDAEGISTFYRKIPGSPVYALRGFGNVEAPVWKVASVLLDSKRGVEWIDSLAGTQMLKRLSPFSYIEYNHIRTPFVLKDRDFVTQINIEIDTDKRSFSLSYQPGTSENSPKTSYVRGEIVFGKLAITSLEAGKSSRLEGELHCDPKGAIPKWIVNLFQKGWPRRTLLGVRRQAAKADISIPDEFKDILEKTVPF